MARGLSIDGIPISQNINIELSDVTEEDRYNLMGHRPFTLWLTGLSGSGKSTLARVVEKFLVDTGIKAFVLDGDNLRHGLNRDLGFSQEDRTENIRRVAEVAGLMNDAGLVVITAFISPYREQRERARRIIGEGQFIEAFVDSSLELCESRDPKGLYRKARCGEIPCFTGVSDPYEPPLSPELTVSTNCSVEHSSRQILAHLAQTDFLPE